MLLADEDGACTELDISTVRLLRLMLSLSTEKPDCILPFGATTVVSDSETVVAFGECQLDEPLLKDFVVEYCRNGLLQ